MASSVAAPNIAYAVQNGDGGGGGDDGDGSDGSSAEDSSRDRDARSLRQEHKGDDGQPQLTLDNAYRALDDAPEGTRARVMPKENELTSKPVAEGKEKVKNADLEYLDQQLRRRQDWKGGTDVNEIFIQVPDLADPPVIKQWVRSYQKARRGGISSVREPAGLQRKRRQSGHLRPGQ
ncbi:hypothetical protein ACPCIU_00800 [Streptomyces seoulensis]|uniref:hypothetical protein n=1 Tax=Streptomyces seoulensis TaxID=73044 RepID=UPI003C2AB336